MKIKFIIYICFSAVLFCSCNQKKSTKIQPNERRVAMDAVLVATANHLSQKYNIRCVGFAYGCMHQIEELGLRFDFSNPISEEEARKFLVEGAQIMVKEVQNNPTIQPYLLETGFDYKNVSIIAGVYYKNESCFYPNISMIMLNEGKLIYSADDGEVYKKTGVRTKKMKKKETFSEALSFIETQKDEK